MTMAQGLSRMGPLHLVGGALLTYAAISISWSEGDKWMASVWLAMLSLSFVLGMWLKSLSWVWRVFIWILLANLGASLIEWYVYDWPGYGLAGNPNYLGVALAIAMAAAIGNRWWVYAVLLCGGLVWTNSRGAIIAGGVACFMGLWYHARATGWIAALLAISAGIWVKTDGGSTLWQRLGIWQDSINHLTFFGSGWGSFQHTYTAFPIKTNMTALIAPHAYNDFLELAFELGIGAVLVWWLIAICFEGRNWADRLVCVTFGAAALTYFPLWVIGPLFTLTLGHLSQTKDENPWLVGA